MPIDAAQPKMVLRELVSAIFSRYRNDLSELKCNSLLNFVLSFCSESCKVLKIFFCCNNKT